MLKTRFYTTFLAFSFFFTAFAAFSQEIIEQKDIFIDIPSQMTSVKSDNPYVVAQMKFKYKNFPTVTITKDEGKGSVGFLPQELEIKLKETYEKLRFSVISSKYLKSQKISNITTNLFQIEYTYGDMLFISLINIFTYNDTLYYITTINELNEENPLELTLQFQESFLNNISLKKKENKKFKTTKNGDKTATNVMLACVAVLAMAILYGGSKAKS
ncbi:MAG: hypothetical protein ACOX3T_03140 [Bdellovibrionota bacterium]